MQEDADVQYNVADMVGDAIMGLGRMSSEKQYGLMGEQLQDMS